MLIFIELSHVLLCPSESAINIPNRSLAHNRIWSLGPGAWGGAGGAGAALVRLDLGGNPLSRLHPAALDNLPRLVSL